MFHYDCEIILFHEAALSRKEGVDKSLVNGLWRIDWTFHNIKKPQVYQYHAWTYAFDDNKICYEKFNAQNLRVIKSDLWKRNKSMMIERAGGDTNAFQQKTWQVSQYISWNIIDWEINQHARDCLHAISPFNFNFPLFFRFPFHIALLLNAMIVRCQSRISGNEPSSMKGMEIY